MRLWIMVAGAIAWLALAGCAPRLYRVCDEIRCTPPMTHEEAIKAAEVMNAWGEKGTLKVWVAPQ